MRQVFQSLMSTKNNVFGQSLWLKKKIFQIMGRVTRSWLLTSNNLSITGSETLLDLPDRKVLFVANHQTIFTDVISIYHVLFATQNGQKNSIAKSNYLKNPKLNIYFVAARETMKKGILPKIFALAGSVSIDRTWRKGQEMVKREVNPDDTKSIGLAIEDGYVVTFPQGTTRLGAPVRKGTAHIIKQYKPIVVPVRVEGFREAFDKTGLKKIKTGVELSLDFGRRLEIDFENDSIESIVEKIAEGIGEKSSEDLAS